MILPGATLGMLGGGQLGRLFTLAARSLGYRVIVLDPDSDSPAGQLANEHLCTGYADPAALEHLATHCAAISTEFENVPAVTLETLARRCIVRPGARAVAVTQDRIHEKTFLRDAGLPTAPFEAVRTVTDLEEALDVTGLPALLKVSRFGYDGKGQMPVSSPAEAESAFESLGREPCVLEQQVPFEAEVSVVLARGANGQVLTYPLAENTHRNGILDTTVVPARTGERLTREARDMATHIAERLDYVGVMAVEFFIAGGQLLVNEIAPRPHNSGHYTLDACVTSQFEQQVRAVCGLPLGETRQLSPVVMVNLLGDLWSSGEPAWEQVLAQPGATLHLYGKRVARPGRKMGHCNCLAPTRDDALRLAQAVKNVLGIDETTTPRLA